MRSLSEVLQVRIGVGDTVHPSQEFITDSACMHSILKVDIMLRLKVNGKGFITKRYVSHGGTWRGEVEIQSPSQMPGSPWAEADAGATGELGRWLRHLGAGPLMTVSQPVSTPHSAKYSLP